MRRFYCILAIAILAFTACSKEPGRGEDSPKGTVHFAVDGGFQAFINSGVKSAIGDGTTATQMMVGVFDVDGNALDGYQKVVTYTAGTGFDFDLSLVLGLTYKVVLFAQSPGRYLNASSWTPDGLKAISLSGLALNAEEDDAFAAVATVNPSTDQNVNVNLVRPFAQVNVATSHADGLTGVMQAKLEIAGMPAVYNALTGQASGSQNLTLTGSPIGGTYATSYTYIMYAYLPVQGARADVTADITLSSGAGPLRTKTVTNIPLQANYRTNILGDI